MPSSVGVVNAQGPPKIDGGRRPSRPAAKPYEMGSPLASVKYREEPSREAGARPPLLLHGRLTVRALDRVGGHDEARGGDLLGQHQH